MNRDKINCHIFIQFMTSKDTLNNWLFACIEDGDALLDGYLSKDMSDVISSAFDWAETDEGNKFWSDLDSEWQEILNKITFLPAFDYITESGVLNEN